MCQFPPCLKVWTGLSLIYVHVQMYQGLQDLSPTVQPEKNIHARTHTLLTYWGPEKQCWAMRFLSWPRASWELERPQLRMWPTTMSCGPGCPRYLPLQYLLGPRGAQLLVSATPAGFLLTQQKASDGPAASLAEWTYASLTYLREMSYCFTAHTFHVRPTIFTPVTPFLETEGLSAQGSLSLILFREGGKEAERSVLFLLSRAVWVQGLPHLHTDMLHPAQLICSSLAGQCSSASLGGVSLLLQRTGISTIQGLTFKSLLPQADLLESLK